MEQNLQGLPTESADLTMLTEAHVYQTETLNLPYRLYVPKDYTPTQQYPLILFLHGSGERGNDNCAQLKHAIGQMFADPSSPVYQCIVVAPQCPADSKWVEVADWTQQTQYSTDEISESAPLRAVVSLLEQLKTEYSVDADRIYASGLSMGGYGTWDLLVRHTDLFAAGIPVCGGADYRYAERLKNVPIYTFHGLKDPTVPYIGTERMVQAIRAAGGTQITYIPYPDGDHAIWETAFATDGLFDWLLAQKRSARENEVEIPNETETTNEAETTNETETANETETVNETERTYITEELTESTKQTPPSDGQTKPGRSFSHFLGIVVVLAGIAAGTAVIATILAKKKRH